MSNRRTTKHWTATCAESYPEEGPDARKAELAVLDYIIKNKRLDEQVKDFEADRDYQIKGYDLQYKHHVIDVKNNLKNGFFAVEVFKYSEEQDEYYNGWIRDPNKETTLYWHYGLSTGKMALYNRNKMVEYLKSQNKYKWEDRNNLKESTDGDLLAWFSLSYLPNFIKTTL